MLTHVNTVWASFPKKLALRCAAIPRTRTPHPASIGRIRARAVFSPVGCPRLLDPKGASDAHFGTAGDIDARPAHLFRCGDLYAVSLDPTGSNIPRDGSDKVWEHVLQFELGVHEAVPAAMNPEPR